MIHPQSAALDALEDLLAELRRLPGLVEKKRGVFYRKSKAFLHFHEDPAGLFADIRPNAEWERLPVNTAEERRELVERVGSGQ